MSPPWFWLCLELPPTASVREVKRRYSQLLKINRPEDNPQGFQQLRAAYEICLRLAQQREAEQTAAADAAGTPAASSETAPAVEAALAMALLANTPQQAAAAAQLRHTAAAEIPASAAAPPPLQPEPFHSPPPAAVPDPPRAAPVFIDDEPAPAPRVPPPPLLIVDDPAPATPRPVNSERIGKFLPVDASPPSLREAAAVVDELLTLNGNNEAVLTRWFARCPELMNFTRRDAVELELLRRIAAGARPAPPLLQRAGQEFGWFDLSFQRRLSARGVSAAQWQAIDEALHEAFALAQFADHLQQGKPLVPQLLSEGFEKDLLRKLQAARESKPALLAAFRPGTVQHVNAVLHAYGQRYGGRALYRVFGPRLLHFWRDLHPGSAPNWLRIKMTALRAFSYTSIVWLSLMILAFLGRDTSEPFPGRGQRDLSLLMLLIAVLLVAYRAAGMGLQHLQQVLWPRYMGWRESLLERYVEPWLQPARALPLLLGVTALGMLGDHLLDPGMSALFVAVLTVLVFGFSGLISLLPAGLLLAMALLLWNPQHPLWFSAGAGAALGLLWLADRLARRKTGSQAHWERRFIHVLLLSVLICAFSFGIRLLLGP